MMRYGPYIPPPPAPQCNVCPWYMAGNSPNFCDGALLEKPSCWWECEARPEMELKARLRGAIQFRAYCQEQGLTDEAGHWLFDLPQDWTWNGETWILEKVVNFSQHKRLKLQELKEARK